MDIKKNIENLLASQTITNYQISKETGIAQSTLSDYTKGKTKIGNMKLDHAVLLNEFYLNNMEKLLME